MTYKTENGTEYIFSYRELKFEYEKIVAYSDSDFMENIGTILHLSCYIAWIKELDVNVTLSDNGIIHQLVHLLTIPSDPVVSLPEIRQQFNEIMRIS